MAAELSLTSGRTILTNLLAPVVRRSMPYVTTPAIAAVLGVQLLWSFNPAAAADTIQVQSASQTARIYTAVGDRINAARVVHQDDSTYYLQGYHDADLNMTMPIQYSAGYGSNAHALAYSQKNSVITPHYMAGWGYGGVLGDAQSGQVPNTNAGVQVTYVADSRSDVYAVFTALVDTPFDVGASVTQGSSESLENGSANISLWDVQAGTYIFSLDTEAGASPSPAVRVTGIFQAGHRYDLIAEGVRQWGRHVRPFRRKCGLI